ncbi:MAG: hypothetical protein HY554_11715 [Elusimicrobia bacterium]|nr:hypothetical protein [Elusimicrobiota bacterium]
MSEQDRFNLGKLAKEIVVSRLKDVQDAPGVAAEVVKRTIVAGVQGTRASGQDPRATVREICRGAMTGLLLIEKDLPESTVRILERLTEAAAEVQRDPQELMTWALEGVSGIAPMISKEAAWKIRDAINRKYMGVGEVFDKLCKAASAAR